MNILVVCEYGLYTHFSSSFVHAQAREYARQGHRVRVIMPIAFGKPDWDGHRFCAVSRTEDGVELRPLRHASISNYGNDGFNNRSALRALRRGAGALLEGFVPDVIHAHTLGLASELGALLKERLGVPLVVTTHGSDTSVRFENGQQARLKAYADQANTVVAVSSALAEKLRKSETSAPLQSILNGFHVRAVPETAEKAPCSLIQVGNLIAQKKNDVTLRAFAQIHAAHSEATLTVIGQGEERNALQALAQELGLADAVRFTGQLPNEQVLGQMARARFFCMPSVREGFGIVYLEAMAARCVTIGTEGEGIADLIRDGENGYLVPPDDPGAIVSVVERCLAAPEETAALTQAGSTAARSLTWEKNAGEYLRLFEELRK